MENNISKELENKYNRLESANEKGEFLEKLDNIRYKLLKDKDENICYCNVCGKYVYKKDVKTEYEKWVQWINDAGPLEKADWKQVEREGFRNHCPLCGALIYKG